MIYHLLPVAAWQAAQQQGEYRPESLAREGFIHFSSAGQVEGVRNAFYRDVPDLLLLQVDESKLRAPLKWEPPVHPAPGQLLAPQDALFPHLYGPLNLDAVVAVSAQA